MHIFGLRYYLTLGGLGRVFTQFFISGAASVSIVISNFKKTYDEFQFEEKQDEHAEIEKIGGKKEEDQENDQIN